MKAVLLEVPDSVLEDRRRRGLDKRDELWDGVLHMVPPASELHQRVGGKLFVALQPLAERRGLGAYYETGLFRTDNDYRVPDQAYVRPEVTSERGIEEGADAVVELVSPGDETYDKIDWYAARGVGEMLIVHPSERRAGFCRAGGDGPRLWLAGDEDTSEV